MESLRVHSPRLDAGGFIERRSERYERLKTFHQIAYKLPPIEESGEAKELLDEAVQETAEYASMARAAVRAGFELVS